MYVVFQYNISEQANEGVYPGVEIEQGLLFACNFIFVVSSKYTVR